MPKNDTVLKDEYFNELVETFKENCENSECRDCPFYVAIDSDPSADIDVYACDFIHDMITRLENAETEIKNAKRIVNRYKKILLEEIK